jgi:hypothetical protein
VVKFLRNSADERNLRKSGGNCGYGEYSHRRCGCGGDQLEKPRAITMLEAMSLQLVDRKSAIDSHRHSDMFKNEGGRKVWNQVPDIGNAKADIDLGVEDIDEIVLTNTRSSEVLNLRQPTTVEIVQHIRGSKFA